MDRSIGNAERRETVSLHFKYGIDLVAATRCSIEKRETMSYKTIRDLAAQTGVTESALRYYDEKRLLQPTVKSQTGRREWLYDDEAVRKLKHILLLKRIGLSVEDIAAMFGEDEDIRKAILEDHLEDLRSKRNELDRQIACGEAMKLIEDIAGDDGELRKTLIEKLLCRRREGGSSR